MLASIRSLFSKVIDYAGLFPPASLAMNDAVEEYLRHLSGEEAWMVTAFICPSSRLEEFESARAGRAMDIILLTTEALDSDEAVMSLERARSLKGVSYRGWEGKIPPQVVESGQVETALRKCRLEAGAHAFVEVPITENWHEAIPAALSAIREDGRFMAKLRTGGTTPDLVPPPYAVASFLLECGRRSLPVKFTAGLHQATYHFDEAVGANLYGFLNALIGGVFALTGTTNNEDELVALLTESDAGAFVFEDESVRWRDKRLTTEQIRDARSLVRSFGSCSVTEPVEALRSLGLWSDAPAEVSTDG